MQEPPPLIPRFGWILITACVVHIIQGIAMLVSSQPIMTISTAMMYSFPGKLPGIILILIGSLALYGTITPSRTSSSLITHMLMIVPQQCVLFSVAFITFNAMHSGRYVDGTIKSVAHITAGECIHPVFAFCHLCAVINQFLCNPLVSEFKKISL